MPMQPIQVGGADHIDSAVITSADLHSSLALICLADRPRQVHCRPIASYCDLKAICGKGSHLSTIHLPSVTLSIFLAPTPMSRNSLSHRYFSEKYDQQNSDLNFRRTLSACLHVLFLNFIDVQMFVCSCDCGQMPMSPQMERQFHGGQGGQSRRG